MQYWLRLGIKVSIAFELLASLTLIGSLSVEGVPESILSYGGIIAIQVYLYRKIGSSWDRMSTIKKVLLALIIGIPAIIYGSMLIIIVVVIAFIILALAGGWNPVRDQANYERSMRDATTRGQISEINRTLGEINRKL